MLEQGDPAGDKCMCSPKSEAGDWILLLWLQTPLLPSTLHQPTPRLPHSHVLPLVRTLLMSSFLKPGIRCEHTRARSARRGLSSGQDTHNLGHMEVSLTAGAFALRG
jgi:hypothetical protein